MFSTADGNGAVNQSQACINLGAKHIFNACTMGCMPGVWIQIGARDFSLQNVQVNSGTHPAFCWVGTGVISRGNTDQAASG